MNKFACWVHSCHQGFSWALSVVTDLQLKQVPTSVNINIRCQTKCCPRINRFRWCLRKVTLKDSLISNFHFIPVSEDLSPELSERLQNSSPDLPHSGSPNGSQEIQTPTEKRKRIHEGSSGSEKCPQKISFKHIGEVKLIRKIFLVMKKKKKKEISFRPWRILWDFILLNWNGDLVFLPNFPLN